MAHNWSSSPALCLRLLAANIQFRCSNPSCKQTVHTLRLGSTPCFQRMPQRLMATCRLSHSVSYLGMRTQRTGPSFGISWREFILLLTVLRWQSWQTRTRVQLLRLLRRFQVQCNFIAHSIGVRTFLKPLVVEREQLHWRHCGCIISSLVVIPWHSYSPSRQNITLRCILLLLTISTSWMMNNSILQRDVQWVTISACIANQLRRGWNRWTEQTVLRDWGQQLTFWTQWSCL